MAAKTCAVVMLPKSRMATWVECGPRQGFGGLERLTYACVEPL